MVMIALIIVPGLTVHANPCAHDGHVPLQACPEWLAVINLFRLVFELFREFFATGLSRICVEQLVPLFLLPQRLPLPHLQRHEHSSKSKTAQGAKQPPLNHSICREGQTAPYGSATMQSASICTQSNLALVWSGNEDLNNMDWVIE